MAPYVLCHCVEGVGLDYLDNIRRVGLIAQDTTRGNWEGMLYSDNAGVEAVYATPLGEQAWNNHGPRFFFDAAGLPVERDPELYNMRGIRVRADVPPERFLAESNHPNLY